MFRPERMTGAVIGFHRRKMVCHIFLVIFAYCFEPAEPFSSFIHAITRIVRFGFNFNFWIRVRHFHGNGHAGAVIDRARSQIPRIKMTGNDDKLVRDARCL